MNATLTAPFLSRACLTAMAALGLAVSACSSTPETGGSGGSSAASSGSTSSHSSTGSGSGMSSATSSSSSSGGQSCPAPGYPGTKTPVVVASVDGTVLDINDVPVVGQPVYVCGVDICPPAHTTDAKGQVTFTTPGKLDRPAFKYGDALTYARLAVPFLTPMASFPAVHTVKLPAAGATMAAGKAATSGNVTLTLAAGAMLDFNIIYSTPEDQKLRAAAIPVAKAGPALDPSLNIEILYGAVPIDTMFCPAASVSVPNDAKWPAGTPVEFYVHGVETAQDWAPYGGWAKVSDGKVSADGLSVSTDPAQGLPVLSTFGIRKKP